MGKIRDVGQQEYMAFTHMFSPPILPLNKMSFDYLALFPFGPPFFMSFVFSIA